jgi:putative spermidine/putrescine transport system permease protein
LSTAVAADDASVRVTRFGSLLHSRRGLALFLLLLPPALWFGTIYLGSLLALIAQSFYSIDDYTGALVREPTLATLRTLVSQPAHLDIVLRTLAMALVVTVASVLVAFPLAYYMARYARGRVRTLLYVAVIAPMWTSYLVKVYAWRLILAKEGILNWFVERLHLSGALEAVLATPVVGGPSLASSYLGMAVVFLYMWLPFVILPIEASLQRVPRGLLEASGDLGATPAQTFWHVVVPLAVPGIAAGSVFAFSLTLGDYVIPQVVGAPGYFIGMMVYEQQGTAGNLPLAAAFSIVPMLLVGVYLLLAKRLGAFDAL